MTRPTHSSMKKATFSPTLPLFLSHQPIVTIKLHDCAAPVKERTQVQFLLSGELNMIHKLMHCFKAALFPSVHQHDLNRGHNSTCRQCRKFYRNSEVYNSVLLVTVRHCQTEPLIKTLRNVNKMRFHRGFSRSPFGESDTCFINHMLSKYSYRVLRMCCEPRKLFLYQKNMASCHHSKKCSLCGLDKLS